AIASVVFFTMAILAGETRWQIKFSIACFFSILLFFFLELRDYSARAKDKKLTAGREEETICTFARQLNCRETDTWIIRAVYEELSNYNGYSPRLDDRLVEICEHGDDIDWLVLDISERLGRPLKNTEQNPYFDKVTTVRDLILFFTQQPHAESKAKAPA
ncbi:MAG: hypothetical protein ACAH80_03635, partial [Alphaproteobacteria bacterium]